MLPDSVAKVVKTFGCIAETTETLDEFRYKMLHGVGLFAIFQAQVQRREQSRLERVGDRFKIFRLHFLCGHLNSRSGFTKRCNNKDS